MTSTIHYWPCPRDCGEVRVHVSGPRLDPDIDVRTCSKKGHRLDPSEVDQVEREVYEELLSGGLAA